MKARKRCAEGEEEHVQMTIPNRYAFQVNAINVCCIFSIKNVSKNFFLSL